jgi:phosphoribosyl 1,2-cyclic phosphate phosphodiesterase
MNLAITILGCGSSGGVPRVASGWGKCDPSNPKNRRRRCSILVEQTGPDGVTRVLVDTSPDLREQLLDVDVKTLDGIIITHEHADHTHGIDDLRPLALHARNRLRIWLDEKTSGHVRGRFDYIFRTPPGSDYPPFAVEHRIVVPEPIVVDGPGGAVSAIPFDMEHGGTTALGLRFGGIAYCSDVNYMPPESEAQLHGLDVLIIDALRDAPHPTHFNVTEALELIERVRPKRAVLTNLHTDLDYAELAARLPAGIEPAFDGMRIEG